MLPIKTLFFRFKLFQLPLINVSSTHFSNFTLDDIKASIPKKIERGPTDILKALSQTCKKDPTAYDYKFMDDPYFYPTTKKKKIIYSLCLESGRKSARWIVKQYPQLFDHKVSDPFIKAFAPPIEYNENSEVAEETLVRVIEERNVNDAMYIYSLLKKKGVEISNDTKQLLLELVCFYNCEKLHDEKDYEANWYKNLDVKNTLKTWKDKGFAEELFKDINLDCSLAYSTLIQGMLKYGQIEEAINFFNIGLEKNLKFSVWVYNGFIDNVNTILEGNEQRWNYVIDLLHKMKENQVAPNLYTLNGILKTLHNMNMNFQNRKKFTLCVVNEFGKIGIMPSLGTYYYILKSVCSNNKLNKQNQSYCRKIINEIDKKKWDIQHPDDGNFFISAMSLCDHLENIESANYLMDLFNCGNQNLIGGAVKENIFYNCYMNTVFEREPLEHAMKIYKELVPQVCNLSESLYLKILSLIKENEAFEFLVLIWKDIENFFGLEKINLFKFKVLNLSEAWNGENEEVSAIFENIAETCFSNITIENSSSCKEDIMSNLIITFLKLKKLDKALALFNKASNQKIELSFNAVEHFFNFCVENEKINYILLCLKFAETLGHPNTDKMAQKVLTYLEEGNTNLEWVEKLAKGSKTESIKKEQEVTFEEDKESTESEK